jgi:hypothetical protein
MNRISPNFYGMLIWWGYTIYIIRFFDLINLSYKGRFVKNRKTADKHLVRTVNVPHTSDCLICEQVLQSPTEIQRAALQTNPWPGLCECPSCIRLSHLWTSPTTSYWDTKSSPADKPLARTVNVPHTSDCLCEQVLQSPTRFKEQPCRQTPGQDCECSPHIRLSHLWTSPTEIQRAALHR